MSEELQAVPEGKKGFYYLREMNSPAFNKRDGKMRTSYGAEVVVAPDGEPRIHNPVVFRTSYHDDADAARDAAIAWAEELSIVVTMPEDMVEE